MIAPMHQGLSVWIEGCRRSRVPSRGHSLDLPPRVPGNTLTSARVQQRLLRARRCRSVQNELFGAFIDKEFALWFRVIDATRCATGRRTT